MKQFRNYFGNSGDIKAYMHHYICIQVYKVQNM